MAMTELQRGEVDESDITLRERNKSAKAEGDVEERNSPLSRRPAQIRSRKSFPDWYESPLLSVGEELCVARWLLHCFLSRVAISSRQAAMLSLIKKGMQKGEELFNLREVLRELSSHNMDISRQWAERMRVG